ncbi:MAG: TRAP transporter small permease [Rhizobiaceae bacterium]|nr:TRAP transporter small permease [Rhizobiaceae bacterium]
MLNRFWSAVDTILLTVGGAVLMVGIFHVAADVILKYVANQPIPGTIIYVSNYYMTMAVYLPLAMAEMRNQHIIVDLWPDSAPHWLNLLGLRFTWALSAGIYLLLAWNTLQDASRKMSEGEYVLDQGGLVITWPSYYVLPFSMLVVASLLACKIVQPNLSLTRTELQTNE